MSQLMIVNVVFSMTSLLFIGLSIPLILGKVKPNSTYGMRTAKTLSNPETWYAANKVMGRDLLLAGIAMLVTSLIVLSMGDGQKLETAALIQVGVMMVALLLAVLHSFSALNRM